MVHCAPPAPTEPISTGAPALRSSDDAEENNVIIYQYKRTFEGIVGECNINEPATIVKSALGRDADRYLYAHGYLSGTIRLIQKYFEAALTRRDFVNTMAQHGIPVTEAEYIYSLIIR